jgi:hypothetical protein
MSAAHKIALDLAAAPESTVIVPEAGSADDDPRAPLTVEAFLTPEAAATLRDIIAPLMRGMVQDPRAKCYYEVLSGALVWSDERPDLQVLRKVQGLGITRILLRFRTELMHGEVDEQFREFWDLALRLFPEWPGFDPKRRSIELRPIFHDKSAESNAELDEIERELDKQFGCEATGV